MTDPTNLTRAERGAFDVWAPCAQRLRLSVADAEVDMHQTDGGWWTPSGTTPDPTKGDLDYGYLIDDSDVPRPDPRSRRQPAGRHRAPGCSPHRLPGSR